MLIKFGPVLDAATDVLPFITEYNDKNAHKQLLQSGDVIIADTAEDEAVGKATEIINVATRKVVSGLHTIACRPRVEMTPTYLVFYINSEIYHQQLYSLMQGVKVLSISKSNIEGTTLCYPTEAEQQKICALLNLIELKIVKQKKLIELLKKYKRGLLKQVFNENCTWDEVPLGKIATIYQPQTISSEQLVENGKYPVYGANGQIGWYNDFNHDSEQIAICCRGASCGTVNYIPAYSWITGNAMVINIADSVILKKFVYHQLCSQNLSYMISGSGQPQIVRTPCVEHKIFVPTSEVQAQITALFDLLDQKIAIQEKVLDTLIITKKGYLQKLFV
ncbi:MAG: restriction endonuclease subunit S [Clostridia bacterium]|nr:restriction endonuclease subunit S [Clostridia bacterium]